MKINVGTKNKAKLNAVKETVKLYDFLSNSNVVGIDAVTDIYGQPKSLNEITQGAMNRAKNSFINCRSFEVKLMCLPSLDKLPSVTKSPMAYAKSDDHSIFTFSFGLMPAISLSYTSYSHYSS